MYRFVLLILTSSLALPAADVLTVDSASTVIVTGGTPAAAGAGEVRLGAGQVNVNGTVTAGDVVIGRGSQAGATEAVRGDDPRLTNARPASGGDAATVGGNAPSAFVATATKGVANGVATLDATGKVPSTQIPSLGSGAKAWVTFNGSTAAIITSSNVSSITKNGTGDYTITFTTAMSSTNYIIVGSSRFSNAGGAGRTNLFQNNSAPTTTTARVITIGFDGAYYDAAVNQVLVFDN